MAVPAWAPQFESYAGKVLDRYLCPGLALGLSQNGEMSYFKGFGYRNVEHELPLTPDTVMGIGSCTKSFTCVAIMQLQEAGLLSVHDPVVKYLPELRLPDPAHTRAVTLHHLMTHTAGLPPLPTLLHAIIPSMKADPALGIGDQLDHITPISTPAELIDLIANTPFALLGPPGTRFSYSNDGFGLLGAVIGRVSGMDYISYVTERILKPAGMTRSSLVTAELEQWLDVATLYASRKGADGEPEVVAAPGYWEMPGLEAAGHLRSTVRDLLRYCELYRTGGVVDGVRLLSQASVQAMTTPYVEYLPGIYYGYGLQMTPDYNGVALIEHGGSIKGVSAQFTVMPGRDLAGVALTNLVGVPASDILLSAINCAAGLPMEARRYAPAATACTPEELARYEGEYPTTEGIPGLLTFAVEAGKLTARTSGGMESIPPTPLTPAGPDRFFYRFKETTTHLRFHRDGLGQICAVQVGLRLLTSRKFCHPEE